MLLIEFPPSIPTLDTVISYFCTWRFRLFLFFFFSLFLLIRNGNFQTLSRAEFSLAWYVQYQHSAQHVTKYLDFYRNDISFFYLSFNRNNGLEQCGFCVGCISEQWREEIIGLSGKNVSVAFTCWWLCCEDSDYQNGS